MEFGKLIPQVFFDLLARFVPGAVILGTWIVLHGEGQWAGLLNAILAGQLDGGNVVAIATLVFVFMSFLIGHILAFFAKRVQRFNEWRPSIGKKTTSVDRERVTGMARTRKATRIMLIRRTRQLKPSVRKIRDAGANYDWLRANHPETGGLCAKIRAEFLMYDALSVAFIVVASMAIFAQAPWLTVASLVVAPIMVYRGAETEETFQKTVGQFRAAYPDQTTGRDPRRQA